MEQAARPRWWALALGAVFVAAWLASMLAIPRGPHEFAYFPMSWAWPWAPARGFTVEQLAEHGLRLGLLLPGLLGLTWGLAPVMPARWWPAWSPARWVTVTIVASTGLMAALMLGLFRGRALVVDELGYTIQARLFARGRLAADHIHGLLPEPFDVSGPAGFTQKYLFGEGVVQVPGVLVGVPAIAHLGLAALTLWAVWQAARIHVDERAAAWIVALIGLSPMFLFTGASGLSNLTALACVAVAAWGHALTLRERWLGPVLVGLAVGACGCVRPQVAVPVGGVLWLATGWTLVRGRSWLGLLPLVALPLGFAGLIAAYDVAVTGAATRLPWTLWSPRESYGFGQVLGGHPYQHGPGPAVQNLLTSLIRFNGWWLGWPASLALLWLWWRRRPSLGSAGVWLWAGLAQVAFLFFYYAPGPSETGPIYYFEALLPAALLGGVAVADVIADHPRRAALGIALHFVLGTGGFVVGEGIRLSRELDAIHSPAGAVLDEIERPALIFAERDCPEAAYVGWMRASFPMRAWGHADPVVVFARPPGPQLDALRAEFADRACYYHHLDPAVGRHRLHRCEEVPELLDRPAPLPGGDASCVRTISTAERLGWLVVEPGGSR